MLRIFYFYFYLLLVDSCETMLWEKAPGLTSSACRCHTFDDETSQPRKTRKPWLCKESHRARVKVRLMILGYIRLTELFSTFYPLHTHTAWLTQVYHQSHMIISDRVGSKMLDTTIPPTTAWIGSMTTYIMDVEDSCRLPLPCSYLRQYHFAWTM